MDFSTAQALIRFGFGPRAGEAPPADPHARLVGQVGSADPASYPPGLPTATEGLTALREQRRLKPPPGESLVAPLFDAEVAAQLDIVATSAAPFRERLVWFWSNHFTVSQRQGGTAPLIGAFVREAIRPHVTGRFSDMLLAVMRHPAMLLYLDNAGSVGPSSRVGARSGKGLNENLARECLELHTVSPASGYTQADVTAFEAVLTGWSVDMQADRPGFVFRGNAHEPGDKEVMGRRVPEGEAGGLAALDFLADHPATHAHLARKLAVHFVSDTPAPAEVARLARMLQDTRGDLGVVSLALTGLPGAWRPGTKFRSPLDFAVAAWRALGVSPDPAASPRHHPLGHMLAVMGQPLWRAPLPNGWPDRAQDWSDPEAMMTRIDCAYRLSGRGRGLEPIEVAETGLGPFLQAATRHAIEGAGDRRDALTLLFSSPDFQRR